MPQKNEGQEENKAVESVFEEYENLLNDYQKRERRRRMLGPLVSLAVHIVIIVIAAAVIVPQYEEEDKSVEISTKEMEIKELDQKTKEELEELEEMAEEVVPDVSKPEVSAEQTEQTAEAAESIDKPDAAVDSSIDTGAFENVKPMESGMKVSNLYGARASGNARKKARKKHGGSKKTERAVLNALKWLKQTQKDNGAWGEYQGNTVIEHSKEPQTVAISSFALLAFLAHGETPQSEEFGSTVQKAIQYLTEKMMNKSKVSVRPEAYENGIHTYALAEAYGLTKLPFLKAPVRKGITFIVEGQQKSGGWNYGYDPTNHGSADNPRWDLSVSGWQMQALKAAHTAGIEVDGMLDTIKDGIKFVKDVTYKDGRFGYSSPGADSWAMQGTGLLVLQLTGERDASEVKRGLSKVYKAMPFSWPEGERTDEHEVYGWYYLTQAMFHGGSKSWEKWNDVFSETVVERQHNEGFWRTGGGLWMDTALLAMSLQVYYRYLPTYEIPGSMLSEKQDEKKEKGSLDVDSSDTEGLNIEIQ